jgi:hypothetical protein
MVFNTTFNNISVLEYLEKTTNLPQVTDKLYLILLYQTHKLVVIGNDCIQYVGSHEQTWGNRNL